MTFAQHLWRSLSTPTARGTGLSLPEGTLGLLSVTPTVASSACSQAVEARPIRLTLPMCRHITFLMSVLRRPFPTFACFRSATSGKHQICFKVSSNFRVVATSQLWKYVKHGNLRLEV